MRTSVRRARPCTLQKQAASLSRRRKDAAVGAAVYRRAVLEGDALLVRALVRPVGDAVHPVVAAGDVEAGHRLLAEVVAHDRQVLQVRQQADGLRHRAGQHVVPHVDHLQALHVADALRQLPRELVVAEVEHLELLQLADLRRDAGADAGVEQDELHQRVGHVADARGQAAGQLGVGEHDDRRRGVGQAPRRQRHVEAVVVGEQRVQAELPAEHGVRELAVEVVEPEVEVLERRQGGEERRERAGEEVVADVELVEETHVLHGRRQRAVEPVGVEVEDREVGKEAEVVGEDAGDAAVVEVDARDGEDARVVRRGGTEHAGVVAHEGAAPVSGQVLGVLGDGVLPRLEGDVGRVEALVERRERQGRLRRRRGGGRRRGRERLGEAWKEEGEKDDVFESSRG
ncbi:hypothetical protein D1007_24504 [Hordeum vulgare]|nr:hypothetical protein D1007_24504 [Hordeum vulgare]